MRVALSAAEAELAEVKPMVQLLQKELTDGKASFQRMQGSTNDTVNGLLQELKDTEDALSQERRARATSDEAHRYKVNELTNNLERAKEHIEQNVTRSKQSSSEKEMRVLQVCGVCVGHVNVKEPIACLHLHNPPNLVYH